MRRPSASGASRAHLSRRDRRQRAGGQRDGDGGQFSNSLRRKCTACADLRSPCGDIFDLAACPGTHRSVAHRTEESLQPKEYCLQWLGWVSTGGEPRSALHLPQRTQYLRHEEATGGVCYDVPSNARLSNKKMPSLWVSLDNAVVSIRVDASVATA